MANLKIVIIFVSLTCGVSAYLGKNYKYDIQNEYPFEEINDKESEEDTIEKVKEYKENDFNENEVARENIFAKEMNDKSDFDGKVNFKRAFNEHLAIAKYRRRVSNDANEGCSGDTCNRGSILRKGSSLKSHNGFYFLTMQKDGNLVLYCGPHRKVIWQTKTYDVAISDGLVFQSDGNLVLYRFDRKVLWESDTDNTEMDRIVMQDDGNLVGYGKYGKVFFSTKTDGKC